MEKAEMLKHFLGIDDDYIRLSQAAKLLGVSTTTLRNWIKANSLKAKKIGGIYYVKKSTIKQLLDFEEEERTEPVGV